MRQAASRFSVYEDHSWSFLVHDQNRTESGKQLVFRCWRFRVLGSPLMRLDNKLIMGVQMDYTRGYYVLISLQRSMVYC